MSTAAVYPWSSDSRVGCLVREPFQYFFSVFQGWRSRFTSSDTEYVRPLEYDNQPRARFLVIDASPSMNDRDWPPTRLGAAQEAAKSFVRAVQESSPESRIAVIAYGSRSKVHCRLTPVTDYDAIFKAIDKISISGSTNITAGLQAVGKLREPDNHMAQTIVLSDGHHNYGPSPTKIAESLKKWSVIETIGIRRTATRTWTSLY